MIKSKDQFLKELVTLPELKDNVMAYVFAINPDIKISSKNEFFDFNTNTKHNRDRGINT